MRLVVAEDSVLLREGLVRLLEEIGHQVVAAVSDAPSMELAVQSQLPDLLIADIRMPPNFQDDGLQAAIRLRQQFPSLPVLVLSQHVSVLYARELFGQGATGLGYLLKDRLTDFDQLSDAVTTLAAGGTVLDPQVLQQLFATPGGGDNKNKLAELTEREQQVLALMASGRTNKAIATELSLSQGSVEKYTATIFQKLQLEPSASDHRRVLAVLEWLNWQQ